MDLTNGITFIHSLFESMLPVDGIFIDATCGNGWDTLFLAQTFNKGTTYSFDIQAIAIDKSTQLLSQAQEPLGTVFFNLGCHSHLKTYIQSPVDGIIYNLGYLPAGDKSLVTRKETTIRSMMAGLELLKVNGLMALMVYPVHPSGKEEAEGIFNYLKALPQSYFHIFALDYWNQKVDSPYPVIIKKIKKGWLDE